MPDYNRIREIQDFESLVDYLNDELDWPIDVDDLEDITFDYEPEEFGLEEAHIVKTKSIKQLRPLVPDQPWGIFYIEFESKRLPVVVLRRILRALVRKKRHSAAQADMPVWNLNDLLFISALGEDEHRGLSFAHFRDNGDGQPQLRTFSWDRRETHFYYLRNLNLENLRWPQDDGDAEAWREQWSSAFTTEHRWQIGASKDLSLELAQLARRTRALVREVYNYELKTGPLHRLYESFRTVLVHDLDLDGFADMVAQTIAYGLFSARATGEAVLGLSHLEAMVPNTNPFLRELLAEFTRISGYGKHQIDFDELGVSELVELLNETDMESVLRDFGRQTGGGVEDPVIHFYELFLNEYDKQQKVQRGVFYTPKPVVSFIVHSVHELLRTEFGLEDGLADTTTWGEMINRNKDLKLPEGASPDAPFVSILDPATGTGTFLETVIDVIYETLTAKWWTERKNRSQVREAWNEYVPKHLLPRLHGFELMMAPYAVAHMKLGLKLSQTGYDFKTGERLRVYLTNTLEPPREGEAQLELELIPEFLSHEAKAADEVKQKVPTTVIVGNPPYSVISANLTADARQLVDNYRAVSGVRIKERGALSAEVTLQDDYIKFVAYAQRRIKKSYLGIIGMITNSNYYLNPTLRGMRYSLLDTFNHLLLVDLGGQSKSGRANDENVFEIDTSVAISIMSHTPMAESAVYIGSIPSSREYKFKVLQQSCIQTIADKLISPIPDNYLFKSYDSEADPSYLVSPRVNEVLTLTSNGIKTNRDHLVIDFDQNELEKRLNRILDPREQTHELARSLKIKNNTQWQFANARKKFIATYDSSNISIVDYRPFDTRWIYFHPSLVFNTRPGINKHIHHKENISLLTMRRIRTQGYHHFFVTRRITMAEMLSSADNCFVFPLYSYPDDNALLKRNANFTQAFIKTICCSTGLEYTGDGLGDLSRYFGPEDLLHYCYALFYSPSYRQRYSEYLKEDYPRVLAPSSVQLFVNLCRLGAILVALHLMESPLLDNPITTFHDRGERQVTKVGETRKTLTKIHDGKGRLHINRTAYFDNVPLDVWEFHIGGYQVCHKWLDDRQKAKRSMSNEDIIHYQRIIVALKETIRLMAEIDEVIDAHGGWPLPGSTSG